MNRYVPPEMLNESQNFTDEEKDDETNKNGNEKKLDEMYYYAGMDFWALGCLIYQCLLGKAPFEAENEYLIFKKIESLTYELPENDPNLSIASKDIIKSFLNANLIQRLGIGENGFEKIKNHSFFKSIDSWDWNEMASKMVPNLPQTPENSPTKSQVRDSEISNDTVKLLNNRNKEDKTNNTAKKPAMVMTGARQDSEATNEYFLMKDGAVPTKQGYGNDCCCVVL